MMLYEIFEGVTGMCSACKRQFVIILNHIGVLYPKTGAV